MTHTTNRRRRGIRLLRSFLASLALLLLCGVILDRLFPFPLHRLTPPPATRIMDRNGRPLRYFLAPDDMWRFPVTLHEVSPDLITAILDSEDRWLGWHPGVNPVAVLRALWQNVTHGRTVSGASTIPMQVARLADPAPRTFGSKLVEAFRAVQLTVHCSSERILTAYLNLAPFGGNLVGVGAASWQYFGKDSRHLSLGEIALLTVLPRSPVRYDPFRHPRAARMVRDRVLRRFAAHGVFAQTAVAEALSRPLLTRRQSVPFRAPHFTRREHALHPGRAVITTTLDTSMQTVAENIAATRMPGLHASGIHNAAIIVLDTARRDVLVHVGSADFQDRTHHGQVDNTVSRRSPGSTLKPFLYALACDQGRLTPETMLLDVPTDFAGYRPENYNRNFQGLVSARTALAESLNVPAVRLLADTGLPAFLALLRQGGLSTLDRRADDYGLALALGGCEVRLRDLTNLYATLASGGTFRSLRTVSGNDGNDAGTRLLSPEACSLILQVLGTVRRPDLPDAWKLTADMPAVAWKTGTSFGHRDAWAVGMGQRLTIGVWVGNADGSACAGISGARHAGPLLFDLFRALQPGASTLPHIEAPDLITLEVCAESGLLPGPGCPRTTTSGIRGVTALPRCPLHRRILVSTETGQRLIGDCLLTHPATERTVTRWPSELTAWARAQGAPLPDLPAVHPDCAGIPDEAGPIITSPSGQTPYVLRSGTPLQFQRLSLTADTAQGATSLYWYVDTRFIARTMPGTPAFFLPAPGRHTATVTDDLGRSSSVTFSVEGGLPPTAPTAPEPFGGQTRSNRWDIPAP